MSNAGKIALGIVAGAFLIGALANQSDAGHGTSPTTTSPDYGYVSGPSDTSNPYGITAKDIVDYMVAEKPGTVATFCGYYDQLNNYSLALSSFKTGYTQPNPPAEAVFDELLSRC